MQDNKREVVLAAGGGIILTGAFPVHDALGCRRSSTPQVHAISLHAGYSVLHQIDLAWQASGRAQQVSIPTYQELPQGERLEVLSDDWMSRMFDDVVKVGGIEGYMHADESTARRARYHFITPFGRPVLELSYYWSAGRQPFFDLSRSESSEARGDS